MPNTEDFQREQSAILNGSQPSHIPRGRNQHGTTLLWILFDRKHRTSKDPGTIYFPQKCHNRDKKM